jgi:hypothetical protein
MLVESVDCNKGVKPMRPTITPINDAAEVDNGDLTREDALEAALEVLKDATEDVRQIATGDYRTWATAEDIQNILNGWLNAASVTIHPDETNITVRISLTDRYAGNITFDLDELLRAEFDVSGGEYLESLRAFHQRLGEMLASS